MYQGKWAIVTGASSGIGRQLALQLADKGMNLVIIARREEKLLEVKSIIENKGMVCKHLVLDMLGQDAVSNLKDFLLSNEIEPFVVVNNAGCGLYGHFMDQSSQVINDMLLLNINALTMVSREIGALIPDNGHLMLVASTICYIPISVYSAYAASKSYVHTFGYALQGELSPKVNVTTLYPGMTDTEFFDVSHHRVASWLKWILMYSPEFVARKGIVGMFKKKPRVIAGLLNTVMVRVMQVMPDRVNRWLLGYIFRLADPNR